MAPFNLLETHSRRLDLQYETAWCVVHVDLLHEWNAIKSLFVLFKRFVQIFDSFNIYLNWYLSLLNKKQLQHVLGVIV